MPNYETLAFENHQVSSLTSELYDTDGSYAQQMKMD